MPVPVLLYFRRFIPTCVGNGISVASMAVLSAVHPHVCGERWMVIAGAKVTVGSSPRVWGTVGHGIDDLRERRFIPTCVGNGPSAAHPAR